MKESVSTRLESFGYMVTESDDAIIVLCITKITAYIQNEINSNVIPEKLIPTAVDMICGEFLGIKKTFHPECLEGLDTNSVVKRIQAGDTSTEFAVDSKQTPEGRLDSFISTLQNSGRSQFSCFRKLRW